MFFRTFKFLLAMELTQPGNESTAVLRFATMNTTAKND